MIDYLNIPYGPLLEEWREVVGYEGLYLISNYGILKSLDKLVDYGHGKAFRKGQKRKLNKDRKTQYVYCLLQHDNKPKNWLVHRIMAIAFVPNPLNKPEVNHKNRIRDDLFISNLEWTTPLENIRHALANNSNFHDNQQKEKKLLKSDISMIRQLLKQKIKQREIAKRYNVSRQMIGNIKTGKSWSNI